MPCSCFGKKDKGEEKVPYLPQEAKIPAPAQAPAQNTSVPPAAAPVPATTTAPPLGEDDPDKASRRRDVVASYYSDECELVGYKTTGSRPPSTATTPAASTLPASASRSSAMTRAELALRRREFFKELDPGGGRPLGSSGSHTTPRRPHPVTQPSARPASTPPTATHTHLNGQVEHKVDHQENYVQSSGGDNAPLTPHTPELQLPPDPDPPPPSHTGEVKEWREVERVELVEETDGGNLRVEHRQQYLHQVSHQSDDERAAEGSCILISEAFPATTPSSHTDTPSAPHIDLFNTPSSTDPTHPSTDLSFHLDSAADHDSSSHPAPDHHHHHSSTLDPTSLDTALHLALDTNTTPSQHSPNDQSPRSPREDHHHIALDSPPSPPPSPAENDPPHYQESSPRQLVEEDCDRPSLSIVGCIPKGHDHPQTSTEETEFKETPHPHEQLPPSPPTPTRDLESLPPAPPTPSPVQDDPHHHPPTVEHPPSPSPTAENSRDFENNLMSDMEEREEMNDMGEAERERQEKNMLKEYPRGESSDEEEEVGKGKKVKHETTTSRGKDVKKVDDGAGEVDDGLGEELDDAFNTLQCLSEEGNGAPHHNTSTPAHLNT